jgi:hypothetical protein
VLFIPAVFAGSALSGSCVKNSCTVMFALLVGRPFDREP